jgi:hypothetical protein
MNGKTKFVLMIETTSGWSVGFIVGTKKPIKDKEQEYLKKYKVKSFEYFTINY